MSAINLDEVKEIKLHMTRRELEDLKQELGIAIGLGSFYPEGDSMQKVAVRILLESGMIQRKAPKPAKRKAKRT